MSQIDKIWAAKKIREILTMGVSWQPSEEIPWNESRPIFVEMGIDDFGDALDYIQGVRQELIELVKTLEKKPTK